MHAFQSRHPTQNPGNKLSTICQHATATKGWSGSKGSHLLYSKPGSKCRGRDRGQGSCILVRAEECSHSQNCREPQRMCVRGGGYKYPWFSLLPPSGLLPVAAIV